jgi:hypothetical protein
MNPISTRKHLVPPITANLGSTVRPLARQPPFRPRGMPIECWGGAMAIDHSLQVTTNGDAFTTCQWKARHRIAEERAISNQGAALLRPSPVA